MHDVFISYSSKNKEFADAICHRLEEGGTKCWYAPRDVGIGEKWTESIVRAIKSCKFFILVFSEESNASEQVLREVTIAVESGCAILPFRVDDSEMSDSLTYYLKSVHWLDAINKPLEKSLDMLEAKIKALLGVSEPTEQEDGVGDLINGEDASGKPVSCKKKHKLLAALILVIVAAFVMYKAFAPKSPQTQAAAIPFVNFSDTGKHIYPYWTTAMFTSDGNMYFVEEKNTGKNCLVKTDTGYPVITDIDLECADKKRLTLYASEDAEVFYIYDDFDKSVKIYDKENNEWINDKGIRLPMSDTENAYTFLYNEYTMGSDSYFVNDLFLVAFDTAPDKQIYTKVIHMTSDGDFTETDISQWEITHIIAGVDAPYENYILINDTKNRIQLFDVIEGTLPDLSKEEFDEIRKHIVGANIAVSPDNRFVSLTEVIDFRTNLSVWNIETGKKVFNKYYTQNVYSCFTKDNRVLCFNEEDYTLTRFNLDTGENTVILSYPYFFKNFKTMPYAFHYSDKLDMCFFSCNIPDYEGYEFENTDHLVVTDLNGEILYSDNLMGLESKLYSFDSYASQIVVAEDMIFYVLFEIADESGEDDINTLIFGARYSKNENGDVVFSRVGP